MANTLMKEIVKKGLSHGSYHTLRMYISPNHFNPNSKRTTVKGVALERNLLKLFPQ